MSKSSKRKRRAGKEDRGERRALASGRPSGAPAGGREQPPGRMSLSNLLGSRPGWALSEVFLEFVGEELWCYEPSRPTAGILAPDSTGTTVSWNTYDSRGGLLVEPPSWDGGLSRHERLYDTLRALELDLPAIEGWRADATGPPPGAQYGAPY